MARATTSSFLHHGIISMGHGMSDKFLDAIINVPIKKVQRTHSHVVFGILSKCPPIAELGEAKSPSHSFVCHRFQQPHASLELRHTSGNLHARNIDHFPTSVALGYFYLGKMGKKVIKTHPKCSIICRLDNQVMIYHVKEGRHTKEVPTIESQRY